MSYLENRGTVQDRMFALLNTARDKEPRRGYTVFEFAGRLECSVSAVHQAIKGIRTLMADPKIRKWLEQENRQHEFTVIREKNSNGEHVYRFSTDVMDASGYIVKRIDLARSHLSGARDIVSPFTAGDRRTLVVRQALIIERGATRAIEDLEAIEIESMFIRA